MKTLTVFLFVVIFLTGCEKTISFKLDETSPRLVVEAMIENDQPPMIILSSSMDYFGKITPEILLNSFVHGAQIDISNGTKTHRLKEYSFKTPVGISVYYYSSDSTNPATAFAGEFNKNYSLDIKVDGKEYKAVTTIPVLAKKMDSLWWKKSPYNPDTNKVILMTKVSDPPGYGNYIRYFTSRNKGPFLPGFNSVFDDQIIDGTTYEIEVEQGIDRNSKIDIQTYSFFNRGDTVTVKFCNIDKATYDFWRTMEYSYASIGNPFASPTRVLSNIQGGALGYFGGYAVQYRNLIIPK
jgi:hypothetical protein